LRLLGADIGQHKSTISAGGGPAFTNRNLRPAHWRALRQAFNDPHDGGGRARGLRLNRRCKRHHQYSNKTATNHSRL
jgi:hypothetical protein